MKEILEQLLKKDSLSTSQASQLLHTLVTGNHTPAIMSAVLTALRAKGESPEEVRGFATAMRQLAIRPKIPNDTAAVDIVGTGGDGSGSLNLSTGSALLTAACGIPVVKHGNRSISSKSGSADVLEQLGVTIQNPEHAASMLRETGFTFLFAPYFHPAMKTIAPIRKALGIRTIFNILGPLTNPATPPFYCIGAFDTPTAQLMSEALSGLEIERAFVVHGSAGWDEATPVGPFQLWDVRPGNVRHELRDPETVGLQRCKTADLAGGDAAQNAVAIRKVFSGARGAHRDALALGAGLALEVTGSASSLKLGIERAYEALDDGSAEQLLARLNQFSPVQNQRTTSV